MMVNLVYIVPFVRNYVQNVFLKNHLKSATHLTNVCKKITNTNNRN